MKTNLCTYYLKILIYYLLGIVTVVASAQNAKYNIVNYNNSDGLPQNSVKSINFGSQGYCWISTEMGIVRFDGINFKVFNSANIKGMNSDRIRCATVDEKGDVYFLTDRAQNLVLRSGNKGSTPFPEVLKNSDVWMPLLGGKAIHSKILSEWSDSLINITQHEWLNNSGLTTSSGDVYIVGKRKLSYFNKKAFILLESSSVDMDEMKQFVVNDIFFQHYPDGKIKAWEHGKLLKNIDRINGPVQKNKNFLEGRYRNMSDSKSCYIYAGKTLYGIFYIDGKLESKILLDDLEIKGMSCVTYVKETNTYFIGSYVTGLYIISPSYFNYPKVDPEALNHSFYSQALTSDGKIFCQGYLYNRDGSFERLGLSNYVGAALYIDPGQQLYYANRPDLMRFDLVKKSNNKIYELDSRLSSIFGDRYDSSTIIMSTNNHFYKMVNDRIVEKKLIANRSHLEIVSMYQTGRDSFIMGTVNGIQWYDASTNKIFKQIMDGTYIRGLYAERDDRVWFSTYGKGYFLYEKGKIHELPTNNFSGLKTIHCFINDRNGYFWLPTNNGLYKVKKDDLLAYTKDSTNKVFFYSFNTTDNLKTNEFNGGCTPNYLWLQDSTLSIPSLEGLVQFAPYKLKLILPDKKIFISEIIVDTSKMSLPVDGVLTVQPNFGNITIVVSSPFFGNPDNLLLEYQIIGIDDQWQRIPKDGVIKFNRIPHGNYRLVVKKLTGFSNDEEENLQLEICVLPPFYNTWWFYLLLLGSTVAIGSMIIRLRTSLLKRNNIKLKEVIDLQTKDLSDTVERLAESEKQLLASNRMKDKVTTLVLHDLRSPIRFLHTLSASLKRNFKDLTSSEVEKKLETFTNSTASINDFTDQFFAWAATQHQNFSINTEEFRIQEVFGEISQLYVDIIKVKNNKLIVHSTECVIATDRNIISVILRNIIDNANNNSRNGEITLSCDATSDGIEIKIGDTGSGLSEEELETYFDRNKATSYGGHGSILVNDLISKLGGRLKVETKENVGTTFTVVMNHHQ